MAASAKPLFRAISGKKSRTLADDGAFPDMALPPVPVNDVRRAHDKYLTGDPDPIRALLELDWPIIAQCGSVWECAVGEGHLAREITARGIPVVASDLIDRGYPNTIVQNFYQFTDRALAPAIITNPPYDQISAKGKARWLKHTFALEGWTYLALLLGAEWDFAHTGGLGALLAENPPSYQYKSAGKSTLRARKTQRSAIRGLSGIATTRAARSDQAGHIPNHPCAGWTGRQGHRG